MPWKKTWPTEVKDKLKAKGLSAKDIATLESYGSLAKFNEDPAGVFKKARKAEVEEILKSNGLF